MPRISFKEPKVSTDENVHIVATTWLVCKTPNFEDDDEYVYRVIKDTENLTSLTFEYEFSYGEVLYIKFQPFFSDDTYLPMSKTITSLENQKGFKFSNNLIVTPTLTVNEEHLEPNKIEINSSDYMLFMGNGEHKSTTWIVEGSDGVPIFKRVEDEDNLTSILLPKNIFSKYKTHVIKAQYHNTLNSKSNYGKIVLTNDVYENSFKLEDVKYLINGNINYYKLKLLFLGAVDVIFNLYDKRNNLIYTQKKVIETQVTRTLFYMDTKSLILNVGENYKLEFSLFINNKKISTKEQFLIATDKKYFSVDTEDKTELLNTSKDIVFRTLNLLSGSNSEIFNNKIIYGGVSTINVGTIRYFNGSRYTTSENQNLKVTNRNIDINSIGSIYIDYSQFAVIFKSEDENGLKTINLMIVQMSPTSELIKLKSMEVCKIPNTLASETITTNIIQIGLDRFVVSGYEDKEHYIYTCDMSTLTSTKIKVINGVENGLSPTITKLSELEVLIVYNNLNVESLNLFTGDITTMESLSNVYTCENGVLFINNTTNLLMGKDGKLVSLYFNAREKMWEEVGVIRDNYELGISMYDIEKDIVYNTDNYTTNILY